MYIYVYFVTFHTLQQLLKMYHWSFHHNSAVQMKLFFNCSLDFPSIFIQWNHEAFGTILFVGGSKSLGSNFSAIDDRVFAELTMREDMDGGLYLLASTLTIYPPLTDLNNINLNSTNINCEGIDGSIVRSAVVSIVLDGEELKI